MHSENYIKHENGLLVVSAKEHGKVYRLQDGELAIVSYTAEHPPTYSDNEGFFTRAGNGEFYGSGNVKEEDDEHNIKKYVKAISEELSAIISNENPDVVYVIEPEHLKGLIEEHVVNPKNIPIRVLKYGNHVQDQPEALIDLLHAHVGSDELDPKDPASVAGEENAEEKRKILEVGMKVSG